MEAPIPLSQEITETITIEQDNIKYFLHLKYINDIISFSLDYNSNNYVKKLILKEIKDKESKPVFYNIHPKDFVDFIKKYS